MLNIAIIGTGNICPSHIEGYLEFKDRCKVVALVDIYPEKAQKMKEKFNLTEAEVYFSHKDILMRDDIHLVSVCTPPYTHSEISVDLLESKKNVLLEKPMATSLSECDLILDAIKRTGKRLSVISQNRFKTPIMKLKQMLENGIAGKVVHAQIDSFWWRDHCYYDLWWRGTWEKEGGGCTLNHAVHHIDMLCWMNGLPKEISSQLYNLKHDNSEVEDYSITTSEHKNKSISVLSSSLVHHGEEQKLIFQCEKAKIQAPWNVYSSKGKPNGFFDPNQELNDKINAVYDSLEEVKYESHTGQIHNVLTALEHNKSFLVTPEDGRNTIEYITSVYKSYFTNQKVQTPLSKNDDFYTSDGIRKNVKNFYEKTGNVENFAEDEISTGTNFK